MRQVIQVLIIGSANPDQSLFIQTIRDDIAPRRLKRARPGAYDNFGEIQVDDDLSVQMFGIPAVDATGSTQRFWDVLADYTVGFIEVVDCTRPSTFADAQAVMAFFHGQERLPCVVAAHRFDPPEATSLQEIRTAIGVDDSVKIIPCDVTQPESTKGVLLELVHAILQSLG
jgi:signal recognition particle receptor subunit beta